MLPNALAFGLSDIHGTEMIFILALGWLLFGPALFDSARELRTAFDRFRDLGAR